VVDACSGLRYILSLFSLGMIYCYFYQRCFWKAAVLLICLVPAAIMANALRVAAMGLWPALQEGFLHSFSGWLIFVFCFGLLAFLNWSLNYLKPPVVSGKGQGATPSVATLAGASPSKSPYLLAALVLIIICGPIALRLSHAPPVPLLQTFDNFPMELGPWQGHRDYLDAALAKVVGADQYLEAVYTSPDHGTVSVWIAYFETQQKGLDQRIHSPIHCLTGAGWQILESRILDLSSGHPARYLLIKQGGTRQVALFWYLQRGRWLASEYDRYFFMGLDGLIKRRNDGAIVRLITTAIPSDEAARERLNAFVKLLTPLLPQFIPH
jgi:EpsI family protein